jgi:endonuclease YncB( thermonuclease family)
VGVAALIAIAVIFIIAAQLVARDVSKEWIVLKNCRLIPNPANDGDSFHVSVSEKEYLFRLYFVDAPETDEMTPRRLVEQAKYFGITVPQAIEVGRAAKEFTREKLSESFTVLTHMSDAMGQSRLERFYGFVETSDGDLGEQLVRNGLARNYGFKAAPPAMTNARDEQQKLQQFENKARQEKIGAWGINAGRLKAHPQTPSSFSFFGVDGNTRSPSTLADSAPVFSPVVKPTVLMMHSTPGPPTQSHAKENTPLGPAKCICRRVYFIGFVRP